LDAKHDGVDVPTDEVLSATTHRKAGWVRKKEKVHPMRGNRLT
jgi:hypothetical protein